MKINGASMLIHKKRHGTFNCQGKKRIIIGRRKNRPANSIAALFSEQNQIFIFSLLSFSRYYVVLWGRGGQGGG